MQESHGTDCVAVITSGDSKAIAVLADGPVLKVEKHDGETVKAGDVVARLDTSALQARLAKAKGDKARAAGEAGRAYAEAQNAERKAAIARRMEGLGVESRSAADDAEAGARGAGASGGAAAGAEAAADSEIKETQRLIAGSVLTAPMDGIVANVKFHEGEVPHTGQTLARVFDPTKLEIKFALPRSRAGNVNLKDHIELTYGTDHHVGATIRNIDDTHDVAIDFLIVVADLDKDVRPEELVVGVRGTVHIADKGVAQ
ncbi:MAG TPA: HlyD family efflux transporter periplasmic adaptor subunit [Kofleriaceae bacterium]|jgi:HlyD family secretion protein